MFLLMKPHLLATTANVFSIFLDLWYEVLFILWFARNLALDHYSSTWTAVTATLQPQRQRSSSPDRENRAAARMSQPATIALCSLTVIIILAALLQSWKLYRLDRTQQRDVEKSATRADDDKFDDEDVWIFGSVAPRSSGNIARKDRCVTQETKQPEEVNTCELALPLTTSTVPTTEKDHPATPVSAHEEKTEELDLDGLHPTDLPALPSPSPTQVCQAQHVRFLHASLVPVPLRSRRHHAETVILHRESDHAVEAFDIAIYRISNGEFHLHPHPLRSHPASVVSPLQAQESLQTGQVGDFDFDFDIGNAQQVRDQHVSAGNPIGEIEEGLSDPSDSMRRSQDICGDKVFEGTKNGKPVSARIDSGVLPRWSMHGHKGLPG